MLIFIVGSMDIFFISYNESNCEENWLQLLSFHNNAKRIHGIKGIDRAHMVCNNLSTTEYFWTVDGDNWLTRSLEFSIDGACDLYMFKSTDPIHGGPTLLGGVKLWRKNSIVNDNMSKGDFSLNATTNKKIIESSYSITRYNSSKYDAWKTAFRHCVKLSSDIFRSRPNAKNLDFYLEQWSKTKDLDNNDNNAAWCYRGYCDALEFTTNHKSFEKLNLINDYQWLEQFFKYKYEPFEKN
jgi:hypothetical protein